MGYSIDAFNVIASDVGVKRIAGEDEESFCRRTAYSAARFWLQAFCMDDGAAGKRGLAKQAMNRRLEGWISALDRIHPGIEKWFDADGKGIPAVYNRLIDIGDLAPNGFSGLYVATPPSRIALSEGFSCITGYFDPTDNSGLSANDANPPLLSGLASLVRFENGPIFRPESWWIRDSEYLSWEKATDFDEIEFADVHTSRWNINRSEVWRDEPLWIHDLALARARGTSIDSIIFMATRKRSRIRLSRISWIQAQELFFYLRSESGNGVVARYSILDDLHAQAFLPIGFAPGHINRILDAIGWPVDNAVDRFSRIIRVETLPLAEELLSASYIGFERVLDGKQ